MIKEASDKGEYDNTRGNNTLSGKLSRTTSEKGSKITSEADYMNCIVSLALPEYINIKSGNTLSYGGDQSWWRNKIKRLDNLGCGVIAMTDTVLYLTGKHQLERNTYNRIVESNFKHFYHFLIARGVPFWKMVTGLFFAMRKQGKLIFSWWAPSLRKASLYQIIHNMLKEDKPIPASYFVFFKKHSLTLYHFSSASCTLRESGSIHSHYFVITGIYKNSATGEIYLSISSWGAKYYILLEDWLKHRSIFSNILYY